MPSMPRLLVASWHCLIDPSSGAAISARELLGLLAPRGWDCRLFCGPALDFDESLPQLLANENIAIETRPSPPDLPPFSLHHFYDGPIASTIYTGGRRTRRPLRSIGLGAWCHDGSVRDHAVDCVMHQTMASGGG